MVGAIRMYGGKLGYLKEEMVWIIQP